MDKGGYWCGAHGGDMPKKDERARAHTHRKRENINKSGACEQAHSVFFLDDGGASYTTDTTTFHVQVSARHKHGEVATETV